MRFANFRAVVELWDTPEVLAGEIGVGVWAARKWSQRDRIPPEWWSAIVSTDTARRGGLTLEILARLAARNGERAASR
jgi:hypothetical protein